MKFRSATQQWINIEVHYTSYLISDKQNKSFVLTRAIKLSYDILDKNILRRHKTFLHGHVSLYTTLPHSVTNS